MANIQEITAKEFDTWAQSHPLVSMFQDSRWAKLKSNHWQSKFIALKSEQQILAASLILIRQLPAGFKFWYLPRGPLFDQTEPEVLRIFSQNLKKFARQRRALIIKADPNILLSSEPFKQAREHIGQTKSAQTVDDFLAAGWRHFGFNLRMSDTIQPRFNAVIYLDKNWQTRLTSKLRQYVRKGESMGIATELIKLKDIDRFAKIMQITSQDKGISLRNQAYFTKVMQTFADDCKVAISSLYPEKWQIALKDKITDLKNQISQTNSTTGAKKIAELNNQLTAAKRSLDEAKKLAKIGSKLDLACSMGIIINQHMEMIYGGMDRQFSKMNGSHIVDYWLAKLAAEEGCVSASIGGIEGTLDDPLSEFKQAFGTNVDEYIGEFALYTYPILSKLFDKLLPKIKQISKKLRRQSRNAK